MIKNKIFNRLIKLIAIYKKEFVVALFVTFVISLLGIIDAFLLSYLIDNVLYSSAKSTLLTVAIVMFLLAPLQISLRGLKNILIQKISFKMDIDLMKKFYSKVLSIQYSFFEKHKSGELTSRLNDTRMVRNALSEGVISVVANMIMFFIVGIALFNLSATLFLILTISVTLLSIIVLFFGKFFVKSYPISMERYADLQSFIIESFSGIEAIKTNPANKFFENKFKLIQNKSVKISWNIGEYCISQNSCCSCIDKVTLVFLLVFGCFLVMSEKMSLGQVASFISLSGFFTNSVSNLLDLQAGVQESFAAMKRIFEVLDEEIENHEPMKKIYDIVPEINFCNVDFSYENGSEFYKKFNIKLKCGEWISLVGKTGCGKTTFAKLLLKLYKPRNGVIFWNNEDLQSFDTNSIRGKIAYIPQEVVLFSGTILENITMFNQSITIEKVDEIIRKVGIYEKIVNLQNGINTIVGERGFSLSGGEKQKIAICRALIKNPLIIILDEATSNLDVQSEREIIKIIEHLKSEGKTIISIAHRLSTVEKCDKIYVLENGKIAEEGDFNKLRKMDGYFSKLLNT